MNLKLLSLLFALFISSVSLAQPSVKCGVEILRDGSFAALRGKRVGLITNPTGVDSKLNSTIDILNSPQAKEAGVKLVALYAPEHGVRGNVVAGASVASEKDPATGVTVFSLYGNGYKPKPEMLAGVDVLIFDIQDIGSRSYTFISTMGLAMEAAAENNIDFMVLDRPNPLGGRKVEGNVVEKGFFSFVSKYPIPYIHGMTVGEVARLLNGEGMLKGGVKCRLKVVPMSGWMRGMNFSDTGLEWIPTSPHIPSAQTAIYYPVTGMIGELGTINTGIGYTMPFQLFCAEWISDAERLSQRLNALGVEGVIFRPIHIKPFYGSAKDKNIHGVQVHVVDLELAPLTLIPFYVVQELVGMYPSRSPFAAAAADRIAMFDKVMGSDRIRKAFVAGGHKVSAIKQIWESGAADFAATRAKYLIY